MKIRKDNSRFFGLNSSVLKQKVVYMKKRSNYESIWIIIMILIHDNYYFYNFDPIIQSAVYPYRFYN